jgi:hypothetical protein
MAITPSYKTEAIEEEYIDKGAVMTPQVNPMVEARYSAAEAEANAADYVEWPTDVHGQEKQGF